MSAIIFSICYGHGHFLLFIRGYDFNSALSPIELPRDATIQELKALIISMYHDYLSNDSLVQISNGGVLLPTDSTTLLSECGVASESVLDITFQHQLEVDIWYFGAKFSINCTIPIGTTDFFGIIQNQIWSEWNQLCGGNKIHDSIGFVFQKEIPESVFKKLSNHNIPDSLKNVLCFVMESEHKYAEFIRISPEHWADDGFKILKRSVIPQDVDDVNFTEYHSIIDEITLDQLMPCFVNYASFLNRTFLISASNGPPIYLSSPDLYSTTLMVKVHFPPQFTLKFLRNR